MCIPGTGGHEGDVLGRGKDPQIHWVRKVSPSCSLGPVRGSSPVHHSDTG